MNHWAVLLPLGAAIIYVLGTLFIKQAVSRGAAAGHVNVAVNLAMGLLMQPFWLFPSPWPALWHPIFCGLLFFLGQSLTFLALSRGDVSIATPLMGTKILFVSASAVLLFGARTDARWWAAVVLSTVAVALVTMHRPRHGSTGLGRTAALSIGSAALFGLADVLVQQWADAKTLPHFLAIMFATNAALSCSWHVLTSLRKPLLPPREAGFPLGVASALLAVQVLMLAVTLACFKDATATNILYSTRCVWSVVLAWCAGHWFAAHDAKAGSKAMLARLSGAVLLLASIFLIVSRPA